MPINYQIQELPDALEGERRTYPRPLTYNQFGHKKMASRIAMESGVQRGVVEAVLTGLPDAIKHILLEGHTVKINGLGTFSLSLAFKNDNLADSHPHVVLADAADFRDFQRRNRRKDHSFHYMRSAEPAVYS